MKDHIYTATNFTGKVFRTTEKCKFAEAGVCGQVVSKVGGDHFLVEFYTEARPQVVIPSRFFFVSAARFYNSLSELQSREESREEGVLATKESQ